MIWFQLTMDIHFNKFLVMLVSTTLSPSISRPVSYFLQVTRGAGLPLASQMMFRSSPAVTSRVLSHAWICGGTEKKGFL